MSSLFDKAIADAKELKETALKNAEHLIIEKYSSELKETIENMLEQDEEEDLESPLDDETAVADDELAAMGGEEELGLDVGPAPGEESLMAQVPDAASAVLSGELDDNEEIEIDFDELRAAMDAEMDPSSPEDLIDREEEIIEPTLGAEENPEDIEAMMEELTEDQLTALLEDVDVDIATIYPSNGWAGSTQSDKAQNVELVALGQALEEELETERKKNKKLTDQNVELTESLKKTRKNLAKAKYIFKEMKNKIGEANLRNAKLFYTTKVLETKELNTRQKNKIVESLAKAKTTEETKLVYQTLKESVGSTKETAPESLVEAVNRTRSLVLSSRKQEEKPEASPMYNHWKKLAGINKP
jgi:hypothetical protein